MAKEKNPSIYNPSGETTLGLNNSGVSDSGHGYFINKEKEADMMRKDQVKNNKDRSYPSANDEAADKIVPAGGYKKGGKIKKAKKSVKAEGQKSKSRLDKKSRK